MQSYIVISHTDVINPISYIYSISSCVGLNVTYYGNGSNNLLERSSSSHVSVSKENRISVYHGLEGKHSEYLGHDVNYANGIILGRLVTKKELLIAYETFGHHFHSDPSEMYIKNRDKFIFYDMDSLAMTEIGIPVIPDDRWVDYCKLIEKHLPGYNITLNGSDVGICGSHIPVEDFSSPLGFRMLISTDEVMPISRTLASSLIRYFKAIKIYIVNHNLCKRCDNLLAKHIYSIYSNSDNLLDVKTNIPDIGIVSKEDVVKYIKNKYPKMKYKQEVIENYDGLKDVKDSLLHIDNRSSGPITITFLDGLVSNGNIVIIEGYTDYHYPWGNDDTYYYTCTTNTTIQNKIIGKV